MRIRAFFAHPSGMDEDAIWDACIDIRDIIAKKQGMDTMDHIRVISGREDFQSNFRGNWEDWQTGVITRQNSMTGKPVYDVFITGSTILGRATAGLLNTALQAEKPVFHWTGDPDVPFERIAKIVIEDPEDWTHGYRIEPFPSQLELFGA